MEVIQALRTRRSIRKFTNEPVTPEQVKTMLECAMLAPSAGNQQPWEFIVIEDLSVLHAVPTVLGFAKMAAEATCAIVVCGNKSFIKAEGFWQQDCAAATQNILLAAHGLGLGTCWCGVYPNEKRAADLKHMLNIPENVTPLSFIAIGVPNEQKEQPERFNEARVHRNMW